MHQRYTQLILLAALCSSTAIYAQPAARPGGKPMAMPVNIAPVKQGVVSHEVTAVGNLLANESVIIRPEIAGRVTAIHFSEGQKIAAGAKLVSLDASELRAQRAGSDSDLLLSQQRHDRAAELYSKKFISSQALDDARSSLAKAKARIGEDEARIAKTELRAPFAGTLGLRMVSPGAYIKAGEDIVRLEDISVVKLDFRLPEAFLAKLRRDQEVNLQVDAYPQRAFKGRTYAYESALDEKTRTVLVRARVANPSAELKPGMFARVSLTLEVEANALTIPEEAIVPRGGQTFVFRVIEGKAALTQVVTGSRQPGSVQILKGLAATDRVVTDGHQKLQDGTPVRDVAAGQPAPAVKPAAAQVKGS